MSPLGRRRFLAAVGAAAAGSAARAVLEPVLAAQRPVRIAVLHEPGLPAADAATDERWLIEAVRGLDATMLAVRDLARLEGGDFDVLLTANGSVFPQAAWPRLLAWLSGGGNWVHAGGVPFAVPAVAESGGWRVLARHTNHHKRLGLTHAFPVELPVARTVRSLLVPADALRLDAVYAAYWRFTRERATPGEDGSDGEREAELTPLAEVLDAGGRVLVAPVVEIDRLGGPFAGGRWILVTAEWIAPSAVGRLLERAAAGARRFMVEPSLACYHAGETPRLTVSLATPARAGRMSAAVRLRVTDANDLAVAAASLEVSGDGPVRAAAADVRSRRALPPGFYRVRAEIEVPSTGVGTPAFPMRTPVVAETGFWVRDEALLSRGEPFAADEHTLLRGGRSYPVTGTTYMASDVHRRFLWEPNPAVWDRDMEAIRAAGGNMVRTGIWTGWRRIMPEPGAPDERVLRAFEAFVHAAKRHDLPLIFSFFAFIPEAWGGTNAYLDPAAVAAQQSFLRAFAERVRTVPDLVWDLINEPSFANPRRLWQCRPNGDENEARAWASWLRERYPAADEVAHSSLLQDMWRAAPGEDLGPPPQGEFGDRNLWEGARPLRTATWRLFAQEQFAAWARTMRNTLRSVAPRQLVMVGQDEGGTGESPSNQVFGAEMDLTSIHTWWLNDDLVWDHVVSKAPGRPNLAQETGIMFVETLDGRSWRTERESRDLLERKLAIALGVGAAGYIEWIWNLNTTMPLDNESTIGLTRPDGSRKPESEAWEGLNRFAPALSGIGPREREPVAMVIPHSNLLSARNQATEATKRCVRVMHYHCRVPMAGVSELALGRLGRVPRLVIVPAPRVLTETAWTELVSLAERGAAVLVTGPCGADEYWRPVDRFGRWDAREEARPVAQREEMRIGEATLRMSFRGDRITRVERAVVDGAQVPQVRRVAAGRGAFLLAPVPVELAHEEGATEALYRHALEVAGIEPPVLVDDDDPGLLVHAAGYRDAVLFTVVSEMSRSRRVRWTCRATRSNHEVMLGGGRAALVLVERRTGREIARYVGADTGASRG